jgi:hypothetical protein
MTVKLSDEQHQALAERPEQPVRVVDERTNTAYVLLREDGYERVQGLLEKDDFDIRQAYPLMDAVAAKEGWADPDMDAYNDGPPDVGRLIDRTMREYDEDDPLLDSYEKYRESP